METAMLRTLLALVLVALPGEARSREDVTFDVWQFPLLEGWTKTAAAEVVSLARIDGAEFCLIALYKSRPTGTGSLEQEFAQEWKEVVQANFKTGELTKIKERRLASGIVAQVAAAETRDKQDGAYYTTLYALAPYGRVASVVVTSNTAAILEKYSKAIMSFLDSLKVDVDGIAKQMAAKAGELGKAEAIPGTWATSRSGNFDPYWVGLHHGSSVHLYDFKNDGTYTYRQEARGGSYLPDQLILTEENGTYALDGNKLTLSPQAGTAVIKNRAGELQKKLEPRLEKVTYVWQFYFFEGLQETELVLTPPGQTSRDGLFASNALFSRSYLLSSKYRPEWTKLGK
jgi:hypothetical protein